MTSHEGRSARQSKRLSYTALYLSMSQKDKDLEIEDDLARGRCIPSVDTMHLTEREYSAEDSPRLEDQDIEPVEEEFCAGKRRSLS